MRTAGDLQYGLDLAAVDPASLNGALAQAAVRFVAKPGAASRAVGELALEQGSIGLGVLRRLLGAESKDLTRLDGDPRFTDRAWRENPVLSGLAESYLATTSWAHGQITSADLPPVTRRKAELALEILADAVAPTNLPFLNPAVVKEAIDTGGLSVARGAANFLEDLVGNGGLPSQVDRSSSELGRDLAATPGRVVFRNDLIELLAYEPRTEQVFAEPILYNPSWINKYYVLDLSPGRSFIEYAVDRGFAVFAISYRNPDESMQGLTLDDYLRQGVLAALDRTAELSGSERVNLLGVCIGGTLTVAALAVLAARGEAERVGWATLLNTLVDYGEPGAIGAFTDERTIERIERRMAKRGFLSGAELAGPFTWMRGNDLVWRYVVSSWYQGKRPAAFDILSWNADATRLPATMHSQFLRACYLDNRLVEPGAFTIDGTPVDLSRVETPLYVLASETDHIAPWESAYRTTQLVGGEEVRFVLTRGGHTVGMVTTPQSSKAWFRANGSSPGEAAEWLRRSEQTAGSWWEDWAAWAAERSGEPVAPATLPDGEPAPGRYVRG